MDEDDRRIQAILGKNCERTMRNAARYRDYLLRHLPLPVIVTGLEAFPWEEFYLFGGRDGKEYEQMKKTNPSWKDTFELQALEPPNEYEDVTARVKRISDGKVFRIGLSWLCCGDKGNKAHTLLDDYGVWHTNF